MTPVPTDELIALPAGEITLAGRGAARSSTVSLSPYRIGAVPVTQALYARVTGRRPSLTDGASLPVEQVSWCDAVQFCNTLSRLDGHTPAYRFDAGSGADGVRCDVTADGYRLPTEAEWEHACRAGTTTARYGELDDIAWYRGNSAERIHQVAGKRPNAWGLHDMLGNVWEWCWDVLEAADHPGYRVLRGGGWFDEPWSCRASVRRRGQPSFRIEDVGFRIARSGW